MSNNLTTKVLVTHNDMKLQRILHRNGWTKADMLSHLVTANVLPKSLLDEMINTGYKLWVFNNINEHYRILQYFYDYFEEGKVEDEGRKKMSAMQRFWKCQDLIHLLMIYLKNKQVKIFKYLSFYLNGVMRNGNYRCYGRKHILSRFLFDPTTKGLVSISQLYCMSRASKITISDLSFVPVWPYCFFNQFFPRLNALEFRFDYSHVDVVQRLVRELAVDYNGITNITISYEYGSVYQGGSILKVGIFPQIRLMRQVGRAYYYP